MPVNFNVFKTLTRSGESLIRLNWTLRGCRVNSSIGICVPHANWDNVRRQVKGTFRNQAGMTEIMVANKLNEIKLEIGKWTMNLKDEDPVNDSIMKNVVEEILRGGRAENLSGGNADFFSCFEQFRREQAVVAGWSQSTRYKYGTVARHLKAFDAGISFSRFSVGYLEKYTMYLTETLNMQPVSVAKEHKLLKAFLKWADVRGFNSRKDYLRYRYTSDIRKPVIFLSPDELKRLYRFEVPANGTEVTLYDVDGREYRKKVENAPSLEKVRDLFLFSSFTGLRYIDAQNLTPGNIRGGEIRITVQKTQQALRVNVNRYAQEIIDRYARPGQMYVLPRISNQKYNVYLKDLFEIFGLDDPVTLVETERGVRQRNTYPRWQLMSTHAARRTFVCFALAAGVSPAVVAKFTGHSSLASMRPYIEVATDTRKKAMDVITDAMEL